MICYLQSVDGFSMVVSDMITDEKKGNLHGVTRYYAKDVDEETMEDIKFLKAVTLEIELRTSKNVANRKAADIPIADLSELIDKIGDLSFKQGAQILGEDAFEFVQQCTDEEAIDHIRNQDVGYDAPYTFANEGLSYTYNMGRGRIYKRAEIRTLTRNELRDLVDVLLMAILWQGFCIDDEKVMRAICEQHEDKPKWKGFYAGSHPAGQAHRRIMQFFEDEKV